VNFEEEKYVAGCGTEWVLRHYSSAGSTNDICRELPAWSAVRADVQSKGRGRFGRAFVSGEGGLWISAAMPASGVSEHWAGFSLRVGACLLRYLKNLGIPSARLRWPNDLMCGPRKVAGLLIEQPASGMLIVGFGLNITNEPWLDDPALRATATNLAEWIEPPDIAAVAHGVLEALSSAHAEMQTGGMAAAIEELNKGWEVPSPVDIQLSTGGSVAGLFTGLDADGHLLLLGPDGQTQRVEHPLVERLREILP
jgi:BirA family biotin operon repressor/biotin-[acetyl-CoA-carboxylase] ligase